MSKNPFILSFLLLALCACKTQLPIVVHENKPIGKNVEHSTQIKTDLSELAEISKIGSLEQSFDLLSATVRPFYDETGTHTQDFYTFDLQVNETGNYTFPTIWIGDQSFMYLLGRIQDDNTPIEAGSTQSLTIRVPTITDKEIPVVPLPDVCKDCKALIEVKLQEKISFVRVRIISELSLIHI